MQVKRDVMRLKLELVAIGLASKDLHGQVHLPLRTVTFDSVETWGWRIFELVGW